MDPHHQSTIDPSASEPTAPPRTATNLKKRFNSLNQPRYPLKETNSNIPSPVLKKAKLNNQRVSPQRFGVANNSSNNSSSNNENSPSHRQSFHKNAISPLSTKIDPSHVVKRRRESIERPSAPSINNLRLQLANKPNLEKPEETPNVKAVREEVKRQMTREDLYCVSKEKEEPPVETKKPEIDLVQESIIESTEEAIPQPEVQELVPKTINLLEENIEDAPQSTQVTTQDEKLPTMPIFADKEPQIIMESKAETESIPISQPKGAQQSEKTSVGRMIESKVIHKDQFFKAVKSGETKSTIEEIQERLHQQPPPPPQPQQQHIHHAPAHTLHSSRRQLPAASVLGPSSTVANAVVVPHQAKTEQQSKTSRLAGEELYNWQQSWRKIMKESVVYFEGMQEYNRLQMSEYKRASKLLKQVGCEVTPFYDNDVTIIVSRRQYSPKKEYPSNDIFSNVPVLKIKVWDYDKVFRFLKNLGINIVTGVDESAQHTPLADSTNKSTKHKDNLYNLLNQEKIFGSTDRDPNAKRDDMHYFDRNYLYVYDLSQKVRPIAIREWSETNYPVFSLTLDGKCPFINDPNDNVNSERKKLRRLKKFEASQEYRNLLKLATNSLMNATKSAIQLTTSGFSGTSTSTDKIVDEETTIDQDSSSSKEKHNFRDDNKENEFDEEDTTRILQPSRYNFKQPNMRVSLTRNSSCIQGNSNSRVLDVAASGYNGASNAANFSIDSNSAPGPGNGLGPMTSQVPSRNLNNLKRRIIMKKQQRRTSEKEKDEQTPGYCENCRVKYDNFHDHIVSNRHRNFACNDLNFKDIDKLISTLNESKSLGYVTSNGDYKYA
ncbi:Dbf4 Cdc7p-Dbf4p kinase complex regulatory subunit [Scheffersomyces xylosifermentans]|uniref:Dbf4 Cdc7p-Dbf4p kinase complex regulatory subunit n=1 Tax=Scheffersomyces xylosifermentans TaxID=1304137 RepID=UPI00315C4CF1